MSRANGDHVLEPEESGEELDGLATDAAKKKKRRPKKKGAAGAVAEAAPEPAAPEIEAPVPDKDQEGDEEPEEGVAASKSQKKKQKAKAKLAATVDPVEEEATFAPLPREAAAEKPRSGAAAEKEESEEEEDDGAAAEGSATKKKKKKKKKAAGGTLVVANGGKGVTKYILDEEWDVWVSNLLEATKDSSGNIAKEELLKEPRAFSGFSYTGNLRPAFVAPQLKMPQGILLPDYATDPDGMSLCERNGPREVPIVEGKDLQTMREACRYGREILDIAARYMREGVTGDEIDRVVYQACVDRKIYPSPLNYFRFPKSICVSPNEVICHGIPDSRPIENGDIVNLDVSIYHKGFHSDLNETFFIGDCGEEAQRVVRTAYCALHAVSKLIRPGTLYRSLGDVIHNEAAKNNCAVVTTYCGHGVGQLFHGPPKIPHYRKNKAVGVMKPGHVFTVEPMINIGGNGGDLTWPDNWTAVTKDGKRSAQFEHTFLVTETGVELLTSRHGTDPTCMPEYDPAMFQR